MSHIVILELRVKDMLSLSTAAAACGMELVTQDHYRWYGRFFEASQIPKGFEQNDLGKCEYVLRCKDDSEAYEVGVARSKTHPGEYELLYDFWGAHGKSLMNHIGENGNKLKREYATAVSTRMLRKQGLRVTRSLTSDGKIVLKARR